MYYYVGSQFTCKGEPYDVHATVQAYNHASAQVQLNWITANKTCMCKECLESYKKDYLVSLALPESMPVYQMCIRN